MLALPQRLRGLSSRIYFAFLMAAVIPTAIAGIIGVYYSQQALRQETLRNLNQEVSLRAKGVGRFFEQFSTDLLTLAASRTLKDLNVARAQGDQEKIEAAVRRLETQYSIFARNYPHFYYIRYIALDGRELMRVKRKNGVVFTIPHDRLQDKSQRYYFHEALKLKPGEIYISPMDLNVEYGEIEKPEQPVIRFATPIPDENGQVQGLLVANLHAQVLLEQVQELTEARAGTAYLIDRSGYYLSRSSEPDPQTARPEEAFSMLPLAQLAALYGQPALERMVADAGGTVETGGRIVAHASVDLRAISGVTPAGQWLIAMDFPQSALFFAVAKLSALYAVLLAALATTAVGGFALSRHLLRPLTVLAGETRALAGGDFSRRIAVQGHDEIAALGHQFNTMASRIDELVRSLAAERDRLDDQVRSRTRDLEHERSFLAAVIQHSADGILAVDQGGAITLANAAAIRLLGLNPDPQGQPIVQICTGWPDTAQQAASGVALRRELVVGGNTLALAVQALAPGAGFIIMLRDVTEERRLQDERRELDRQMFQMDKMATLGELAMGLAHEIGNPLAGMKAVAQSLQQHRDMRPAPRTVLARLESEVDRLSTFLQSFHGFAAPQACQPQPCVLAEVLHDVLFWVRKEARTQEVRIVLQGVEGAPRLWADPQACIRCFSCMINCGVENRVRLQRDGRGSMEKTVQQALPHLFHLTPRVKESGAYPDVRRITEFHHCNHCENAPCKQICPSGAITQRASGAVVIQEDLCIGCQSCKDACPYDVPTFSPERNKTFKCHQCHDRVENGLKPACVGACPTEALFSGTREEVVAEARKRAAHYTKVSGTAYTVYGAEEVNAYVGKLGWLTIAPQKDADLYQLPASPYRPLNVMRDVVKVGGGVAAVAVVAGAAVHFSGWLKRRSELVAREHDEQQGQ